MNKAAILFLFSVYAFSASGSIRQDTAKKAGKLSIYGNTQFNADVLQNRMEFFQGRPIPQAWPDRSLENLVSLYREQGFYFFRVDSLCWSVSEDSSAVNAEVWIDEGEPLRIGSIRILGEDDKYSEKLLSGIQSGQGTIFREQILEQDIEYILDYYENHGYPLSRIQIDSLTVKQTDSHQKILDIVLKSEKGASVVFGTILAEGNQQTTEKVIIRESRIKSGKPYQKKKIETAVKYLQKLEYFDTVEKPEIHFLQNRANVTLRIKEGRTNTIDGVIGYNPPTDDIHKGYVTGRLEFQFRNLLGTGRFLQAFWQKKDSYSQEMRFGYEEPWIFGWPVYLGGQFQQVIRDTTYIERNWKFHVRYQPSPELSVQVQGGQAEILPDSIGSALFNIARTESWLLSLGFDYITFDDVINPVKGVRYHTTFTIGRKENLGPEFLIQNKGLDKTLTTRFLHVDAEAVMQTWIHQVVYCGLHGIEVRTDETYIPISDQIRFGGARTLRGYEEDAFRGSLIAWLNLEYRYHFARHSRVFVFIDVGMYQRREEDKEFVRGQKAGYGFGIRMETRLGQIGIDYGIGEGDGLLKGKVHVSLVNRF
jgi:translocation and assembly module TamA